MSPAKAPDPSRRSERSRQAILNATHELLFDIGYPKLTIEAIAARAGVGKQTIYRWWPSKGAVMFDSLLADGQSEGAALPDSGDVEADLKIVLRAIAEEFNDPRLDEMTRALTAEVMSDPALGTEMLERLLAPQLEMTKERLRSAQRAGQLADDLDLSVAVELLFAPLFHRWIMRTAALTPEYADTVVEMAVRAMRPGRCGPPDPAPGTTKSGDSATATCSTDSPENSTPCSPARTCPAG